DLNEASPAAWADRKHSYSWGSNEVFWRDVRYPLSARGVPLELFVWPRREKCAYLASRITIKDAAPIAVHVAATGSIRLIWDGETVGKSDALHPALLFDRLGARVAATAGDHLVALKLCTGTPADQGRARLRIAAPDGRAVAFSASSD